MATLFQTTHTANLGGDSKRSFNPTSFFSKKKKQVEPVLAIAAPVLPSITPAQPLFEPAPEPERQSAPKKVVKKQSSPDVDYELRQHLKREGISFLAFTDPDSITAPLKEEKKKPVPNSMLDLPEKEKEVPKQVNGTVGSSAGVITAKTNPVVDKSVNVPSMQPVASSKVSSLQQPLHTGSAKTEAVAPQMKSAAPVAAVIAPAPPVPQKENTPLQQDRPTISAVNSSISIQPSQTKMERPQHAHPQKSRPSERQNQPNGRNNRESRNYTDYNGYNNGYDNPVADRPRNHNGNTNGNMNGNTNGNINNRRAESQSPPLGDPAEIPRPDSTLNARYALESSMDELEPNDPQAEARESRRDPRKDNGRHGPNLHPDGSNSNRKSSSRRAPPPEMTKRRSGPPPNGNYPPNGHGHPNGTHTPNGGYSNRSSRQYQNGNGAPNGYFPQQGDGPMNYSGNGNSNGNGYSQGSRRPRENGMQPSNRQRKTPSPGGSPPRDRETNSRSPPIQSEDSDNRTGTSSPSEGRPRVMSLPVPIMLPPDGPYITTINDIQKNCEDLHRRTVVSSNIHHRIHCMVCQTDAPNERYLCSYCALRFCPRCKHEFRAGKSLDEIVQLAEAEDWRSQVVAPSSPRGVVSVNIAWEVASAFEEMGRYRGPPRMRHPPNGRRPPQQQQQRRWSPPQGMHVPRNGSPRSAHSSLTGRTETDATVRVDPPSPRGNHERMAQGYTSRQDRSATSSIYEDVHESDKEAKQKVLQKIMRDGRSTPILNGPDFVV